MREQQGAQENSVRMFQDRDSMEHQKSRTRIGALEERTQSMQERTVTRLQDTEGQLEHEHQQV
eukprot:10321710-Prorocentrum_lima.AAC.1